MGNLLWDVHRQGMAESGRASEREMAMRKIMDEVLMHPFLNIRLCKQGDTYKLQIGRLRITWRVVSREWQNLCDEADARDREFAALAKKAR